MIIWMDMFNEEIGKLTSGTIPFLKNAEQCVLVKNIRKYIKHWDSDMRGIISAQEFQIFPDNLSLCLNSKNEIDFFMFLKHEVADSIPTLPNYW